MRDIFENVALKKFSFQINNNPIKSDGQADLSQIPFLSTYQTECLTTRENLLKVCAQTKTCQNIKPAIDGMCKIRYFGSNDPLQDMSIRAAEQMICIIGVCLLCSGLYFIMCWLEKICTTFFSNPENEENKK